MIAFSIHPLGIHCDNALNTGFKSHSQVFPIIMNAIGIPFCHSLNTIIDVQKVVDKHKKHVQIN
jgi:hypothetical protein